MSEKLKEIRDGSFLCVNEEGKAYWGQPEGYPYKEGEIIHPMSSEFLSTETWTFTLKDGSTVTKQVVVSE